MHLPAGGRLRHLHSTVACGRFNSLATATYIAQTTRFYAASLSCGHDSIVQTGPVDILGCHSKRASLLWREGPKPLSRWLSTASVEGVGCKSPQAIANLRVFSRVRLPKPTPDAKGMIPVCENMILFFCNRPPPVSRMPGGAERKHRRRRYLILFKEVNRTISKAGLAILPSNSSRLGLRIDMTTLRPGRMLVRHAMRRLYSLRSVRQLWVASPRLHGA